MVSFARSGAHQMMTLICIVYNVIQFGTSHNYCYTCKIFVHSTDGGGTHIFVLELAPVIRTVRES